MIPGDPQGLRAAARGLVDNAGLHEAIAARHRRLRDGGWTGQAADAFHTHAQRQTTRHLTTGDGAGDAAAALNELADGIDHARTRAGRAATLYADSDPDQRGDRRADPALREQARDLLDGTRAELDDLHARVRVRLAAAHARLPDPGRLLRDPEPDSPVTPARLPALFAGDNPVTTAATRGFSTDLSTDLSTAAAVGPAAATGPHTTADTGGGADPAAMAGPAIERRAGRRVVVLRGDTLYGIAARYLGDAGRWPEILDHNPAIAHPWQIQPGQTLTLPDTTEPADRTARPPATRARPAGRAPTTPPPPTDDGGDGSGSGHPPRAEYAAAARRPHPGHTPRRRGPQR